MDIDKMCPQTKEELIEVRKILDYELKKRNMTGVPSIDKPWLKNYNQNQINIDAPAMSLTDYLYNRNKDRLNMEAFQYLNKSQTYEDLFTRIEDTAKRFQKYGVKENDYINLAMPLCPETIYTIYGLDSIGASAALIDPRVNDERMLYYLKLAKSRITGIIGNYSSTIRNVVSKSDNEMIINYSPLQFFNRGEKTSLKSLYNLKQCAENFRQIIYNLQNENSKFISSNKFYGQNLGNYEIIKPKYNSDRTAIVEYTSGTTGTPKGLELTSKSINLLAEQLKDLINCQPGETILSIMPPFISYGVCCGIHNAFSSGLKSILIPNFSPNKFSELVLKYKPNNIVCVPMFLQLFMESNKVSSNTDLSFIKHIIVGGNKTDSQFEIKFNNWLNEHNCNTYITKGGGMAEYSSCLFYTPTKETCIPGCYGIPLPAVDAKIMDENGKELGYYEIGEIYVSSEQNMKGYLKNNKSTEEFFMTDENQVKWGKTGDLGYVDINGVFTLLSRKKQMVVRPDGHNVFPSEIRNVLLSHFAVKDCIVVGIPDEKIKTGLWPSAFIELNNIDIDNLEKIVNDIENYVSTKLPLRDRPRHEDYYIVDKIIYTIEGKTDEIATKNISNIKKYIKRGCYEIK